MSYATLFSGEVEPLRDDAQGRTALFREPLPQRAQRYAFALAYLLMPKRIATLPRFAAAVLKSWLKGGVEHPAAADVHSNPAGFAGVVARATPQSMMAAHRDGFFPQAHMGPQQWWTREQRYVLFLAERRMPKTLRNEMRKARLTITFDTAFDRVIKACSEPRPGRPKLTWITPDIMRLYSGLHAAGHAHSFELWDEAGALVGGGYGVAVGRVFVTESLFSRCGSASKMALQSLNHHLAAWGFVLNDVKDHAPHLAGMGSRFISGDEYAALLDQHRDAALTVSAGYTSWQPTSTFPEIVQASSAPPPKAKPQPSR